MNVRAFGRWTAVAFFFLTCLVLGRLSGSWRVGLFAIVAALVVGIVLLASTGRLARIRPVRLARPTWSLIAVSLALIAVARTTGSGWLVVVLVSVAAVVTVSAILPVPGLLRMKVSVVAPRDATATRPTSMQLELSGTNAPMIVRGRVPAGEWLRAEVPATGSLAVTPSRRGVYDAVELEVRSAAPLGLVWWRRRLSVPLERALEVGPVPADVPAAFPTGGGLAGSDDRRATGNAADVVRSTREYVAGDPIKLVHWPATARTGAVVVKELEAPVAPTLAVVVDLRGGSSEDAVEAAASRAAGVANGALRAGVPVVLLTAERDGPRIGPVGSAAEVGRRLARAVVAPPAEGPLARGTSVVRISP